MPPDAVQELFLGNHTVAASEQVHEHVEDLRLDMTIFAGAAHLPHPRVELVVTEGVDCAVGEWCRHIPSRAFRLAATGRSAETADLQRGSPEGPSTRRAGCPASGLVLRRDRARRDEPIARWPSALSPSLGSTARHSAAVRSTAAMNRRWLANGAPPHAASRNVVASSLIVLGTPESTPPNAA